MSDQRKDGLNHCNNISLEYPSYYICHVSYDVAGPCNDVVDNTKDSDDNTSNKRRNRISLKLLINRIGAAFNAFYNDIDNVFRSVSGSIASSLGCISDSIQRRPDGIPCIRPETHESPLAFCVRIAKQRPA